MGFIAGPDNPPFVLLRIGRVVSGSIAIALTVFMAVSAFAPALTAVSAISAMSVTFGESLTMMGFCADALTALMTSVRVRGFCPISVPVSLTCGQETLSSM